MNSKILLFFMLIPGFVLADDTKPQGGVFGLFPDKIKKFTIPMEKYWCGGLWGMLGYRPSPTKIETSRDYLLAFGRIKKNIKDARHNDQGIARNTYMLAMAIQCNLELQENMKKCVDDYNRTYDVDAFTKCNNKSRDLYMRTVNESFNEMNSAARAAHEKRRLITADVRGAELYEQQHADRLEKLRRIAQDTYSNALRFAKNSNVWPSMNMEMFTEFKPKTQADQVSEK